jgi:hypothetical protein
MVSPTGATEACCWAWLTFQGAGGGGGQADLAVAELGAQEAAASGPGQTADGLLGAVILAGRQGQQARRGDGDGQALAQDLGHVSYPLMAAFRLC